MLHHALSLTAAARRRPEPTPAPPAEASSWLDAVLQGLAPWAWPAFWTALALTALVAAALVLWLLLRSRRQRRRRRHPAPRLPIVLAHGLMGFDEIGVGPLRRHYFRGVPLRLTELGCVVHHPRTAKSASVAERAAQLAEHVRGIDSARVTIVAHSMGGLDARYAISRLGLGKKVAALVTVGTPHLGTPVADVGTELLGEKLRLRRALELVGIDVDAFYDLTSVRMSAFNREIEDARGVAYASVVGVARDKLHVNPVLLPSYLYLLERVGPNDGLVPAGSQRWGEVLHEIEADHWAQIGWGRFDARDFYAGLARELRGRGF